MKLSRNEFIEWEHKAVTLLGMSGVGKTTLASCLPRNRWFHYSGDYRIGTKYLHEPILDEMKREAMDVPYLRHLLRSDAMYIAPNVSTHNLTAVSGYLGKVGDAGRGGLSVEEFKRRQRKHREAEIGAMRDVPEFILKAREIYGYEHFINDAGGSVCELDDVETVETLAEHTVIIYLHAGHELERSLVERALDDPKPLYYREDFFDANLETYLRSEGLSNVRDIDPDGFVQWMFPRLTAHRTPLYQELAGEYGYTVNARDAEHVRTESEFIDLIANTLVT
ncbi:MAG: ATPase [Gammaproteobacteria bacterium]